MISSPANASLASRNWRVRQRLVTYAGGGVALSALYFFLRRLPERGLDMSAALLALASALMIGAAFWARSARESPGPAHILCSSILGAISLISFQNGGLTAPAAEGFVLVAVLALFLLGPRAGIIYALGGALAHTTYFICDTQGLLPAPPDAAYLTQVRFVARVFILIFVLLVGWRFAQEKQRASEALRLAHDELNAILESLPIGVLVVRASQISAGNRVIRDLTHRSAEALEGQALEDVLPAATRARLGKARAAFDATMSGAGGEEISVRVSPVTAHDARGQSLKILCVEDLRHRKALEAQLQTAQRMASLGTLAAGIGHEINNPLASLMGNLEFVSEIIAHTPGWEAVGEELGEPLEDARSSAKRIAQTVSDLQLFSRGSAEEKPVAPLDVGAAIRSARRLVRSQLSDVHAVQIRAAADAWALGHEPELVRVLVNLMANAAQAMREAGSKTRRIIIEAIAEGGNVEISVSDTGPGIPSGVIDRIFDPFFTTKDVGKGMGLGLSICHQSMVKMGGAIRFESDEGMGTTARLTLEAAPRQQATAPAAPTQRVDQEAEEGALRVLIVDDEPSVSKAVERALGRGFTCAHAISAHAALALLAERQLDVILCDVMMPEVNGVELLERIQARDPKMGERVVFMTGGIFSEEIDASIKSLSTPCLHKPIDASLLKETLRSAAGIAAS